MKRIWRYFRARRFETDLADEMQSHVDEMVERFIAEGLAPEEARARALQAFGNRTRLSETCRERWAFVPLDQVAQDVRYAFRVLRRSPAFTSVAVLSLALGIASNTIIFSAVDSVLLRSLPYPHSDRLYSVVGRSIAHGEEPMQISAADFYDWRAQSQAFVSLSAYSNWPMNLTSVDEPRRLDSELVSADFFSALGVKAKLGRTFLPNEDSEQAPAVIVVSDGLWRAMGASEQILGRTVRLNGSPATIIGVMPADFAFPARETEAWVPLALSAQNRANRDGRWLRVIGRLAPGVTSERAAREMDVIAHRLAAAYPATNTGWSASVVSLQQEVVGKIRPLLLMLEGFAAILLIVACANLTSLLLARAASRTREMGLRAALGAARSRIIRQLLIESLSLAVLGGVCGLAIAIEGIAAVRTFGQGLIPRADEIVLSGLVVWFAVGVTMLTVVVFGLAPALVASRLDLRAQLNSAGRGTARDVERKRGFLVVIEVGMASVLLVAAGLFGESLIRMLSTAPGLQTDHLLSLRLRIATSQYKTNEAQAAFFKEVLDRVRGLPGVVAAGEVSETPLKGNNPTFEFALEGVQRRPSDPPVQAGLRVVSQGYRAAVRIPLVKGRDFTPDDRRDRMPVAMVNETMARKYWPGLNAIGRQLRFKDEQRWMTIVGVVSDIRHMGLEADEGPVLYLPYEQKTQDWLAWTTVLVRTNGEPLELAPAIRSAVRSLDRNQPIAEVETIREVLDRSTALPRFTTSVVVAGSGLAFLIAIVGVYGLLVYTIARRLPELGIRLTLGASPGGVLWLLLRQMMLRVLAGVAAGLLAAWWLARVLGSLLVGMHFHDPRIFGAAAALLVLCSFLAVLAPARRAMNIDPTAALRAD